MVNLWEPYFIVIMTVAGCVGRAGHSSYRKQHHLKVPTCPEQVPGDGHPLSTHYYDINSKH